MKVLHLANWYPTPDFPFQDKFIKEHVEALKPFCEASNCIHVQVKETFYKLPYYRSYSMSSFEEAFIIGVNTKYWRIRELLTLLLLLWVYIKRRELFKHSDIINFHIAYPLLRFKNLIKFIFRRPMVITEHWTAYQMDFNVKNEKKLTPIKNIFNSRIPLITVSKQLGKDIMKFSKNYDLNFTVVPNVVDDSIFSFSGLNHDQNRIEFFMINNWRRIKKPMVVLQAFNELLKIHQDAYLKIGGYGEQYNDLIRFVEKNNIGNKVKFLGKLEKSEIVKEMKGITAFLHPTNNETFSVVTAEALMSGIPVVVTDLPVLRELVDHKCGKLIKENSVNAWLQGLLWIIKHNREFNRQQIHSKARCLYSKKVVGQTYYHALTQIVKDYSDSK